MGNNVSLSVVIPTHNARELTLRCLASLWLCNPQPDEVIVVDDGSTDDTVHSVVRKYPRHVIVRLPQPIGLAAAANHGLARASGDVLLLLDNATEIDRTAVGAVQSAFAGDPQLGIAGAILRHPDGSMQPSGGRIPTVLSCFAEATGLPSVLSRLAIWRRIRGASGAPGGSVDWVAGTAMALRRRVWRRFGPFDTDFSFYCRDMDLCIEAAGRGWHVEVLKDFNVLQHSAAVPWARPANVNPTEPALVWAELLRLANKRFGAAKARQTARALRAGGKVRLFGLRLATALAPAERRKDWEDAAAACATAVHTVSQTPSDRVSRPG